jgi:transcriptional regulator with GAF, ATPase, and Fis domain
MVSEKKKAATYPNRLWQNLGKADREVIVYFVHADPPVSIDTLSSLSGSSAVTILNAMEKLKRKGIVCEKKGAGKGVYFLRDLGLRDFVHARLSDKELGEAARKVVDYYARLPWEGEDKTLFMADLYRKLADAGEEGLEIIKNAADILARSGQKPKAAAYYDHIIQYFSKRSPAPEHAGLFLDSIIGKIYILMHRMPIYDQIPLLTKAREIAQQYEMWGHLARISLRLGRALQDAGRHRKASACINDFLDLSRKGDDPAMRKATSHSLSEYFAFKGEFSEATRCYEEMVGDLEEFGDDEEALMASQFVGYSHGQCGRVARGLGMIDAVRVKAGLLNFHQVVNYCDQASAMALLAIHRMPEAEFYINRLSSFSDEELGTSLAWGLCDHRAFIFCSKGDYEGAFDYVEKGVEHSRRAGRSHNHFPWNFETLSILESRGFFCEGMNLDSLIHRALDGDDIHFKGVAYRYRALRTMEREDSSAGVLSDLIRSERYLTRSGGEIEIARTRTALGRYFLKNGKGKMANTYLSKAWEFFSTIDRNLFPVDLLDVMPPEQKVELMIDRVTKINESLGTIRDMPSFLERVINVAMDFTMALRGAFVVRDAQGNARIMASRNIDLSLLKTEKFRQAREWVEGAINKGTEHVVPQMSGMSVRENSADSLICMPAKLGEEILGYLCLDGRIGDEAFPANQISFLRMLCSQIAVGLSNIRIYEEVREQRDRLEDETVFYKREMGLVGPAAMIIGKSERVKAVVDQIQRVAPTDSSVLILGETGVGKELVAKAIHSLSCRKDGPFIPVSLSVLPQELIASELFGHEKGAFTGASEANRGRFELANGGTIFLDEIGDLPTSIQAKLLRVLQEGTFERLGSAKPVHSDFRVIAATNKDLLREVEKGAFRQDLYYRLNVFPIDVPPLRERMDDIPRLAHFFIDKFGKKLGKRFRPIPSDELKKLMDYNWPGNVRELEHFIERAVILSHGAVVSFSSIKHPSHGLPTDDDEPIRPLEDVERAYIRKTLNAVGWRVSGPKGAASLLGFKTSTLRNRMAKLGIRKPTVERGTDYIEN